MAQSGRVRRRWQWVLWLAALPLVAGCASGFFGSGARNFILVADITQVPESDPFTLGGAKVVGDSLKFAASFEGGCRDHVFTLYASRSAPDTVQLYVRHHANHDPCREEFLNYPVGFDLSGLKVDLRFAGKVTLISAPGADSAFSVVY